jgi:hypothetical protein
VRVRACAPDAVPGAARHRGDCDRNVCRRRCAAGRAVAGAEAGGIQVPSAARLAGRKPEARARADGAGNGGPRRDTGQRVREYRSRDRRGHWRRVVAELCLPADVPADRSVWCFHRDRDTAQLWHATWRSATRRRRAAQSPTDSH